MPPRRGRGRRGGSTYRREEIPSESAPANNTTDAEMKEASGDTNGGSAEVAEPMEQDTPTDSKQIQNGDLDKPSETDLAFPYQVKVSNLPYDYKKEEFEKFLAATFKSISPKIITDNCGYMTLILCFDNKEQQETMVRLINNHIWRKKTLQASAWLPLENRKRKLDGAESNQELKKNKVDETALTFEEELLAEALPLLNVSIDDQTPAKRKLLKPWMTVEVKAHLDKTNKLRMAWKNHGTDELRQLFQQERNKSKKMIDDAKIIHEREMEWCIDPESANPNADKNLSRRERKRQMKPWMTDELIAQLAKTHKRRMAFKANCANKVRDEYHQERRISTKMVKDAKLEWERWAEWYIDPAVLGAKMDPEQENLLTRKEADLLSSRLHAALCAKNAALAGWAEKSCNDNDGTIYQVLSYKACGATKGYRNKSKFRVGRTADGQVTVGLCINDNEKKILPVRPGDKLIHFPDTMKYAVQKSEEFLRSFGLEPYDRRKKVGVWDHIMIRVTPEDQVMMIIHFNKAKLEESKVAQVKESLKTFFTTGPGSDAKVSTVYVQYMVPNQAATSDNLELVFGPPDYEEIINGMRFFVGPASIVNFNTSSSENIYNSVVELAGLSKDKVVIDACAGSCGIAFTCAPHCAKAIAIEVHEDNVRDATKTMALNNISDVEILKGKCEDLLPKIFEDHKDQDVVVVLDPPRNGVAAKAVAAIRAAPNVKTVVYVCGNSKTGIKNFSEFCAAEGKDAQSGLEITGLPFLPVQVIPIDIAPFTIHNYCVVRLDRIDPSTYPPATKPPPEPPKRELTQQTKKAPPLMQVKRRPGQGPGTSSARGQGLRGVRFGGVRGARGANPRFQRGPRGAPGRFPLPGALPLMARQMPPFPPRGGSSGGGRLPRAGPFPDESTLISKYERRIAELEQQDRAFKAGLSMGLQALQQRGGFGAAPERPSFSSPRDMGDYATGDAFGGYRGGYKDPYGESGSPWLSGSAPFGAGPSTGGNIGSLMDFDSFGGGSSGGSGFGGGFGGGNATGRGFGSSQQGRMNPLSNSRFLGVGGTKSPRTGPSNFGGSAGPSTSGGRGFSPRGGRRGGGGRGGRGR